MDLFMKRCGCGHVHPCRETCTACIGRKRDAAVAKADMRPFGPLVKATRFQDLDLSWAEAPGFAELPGIRVKRFPYQQSARMQQLQERIAGAQDMALEIVPVADPPRFNVEEVQQRIETINAWLDAGFIDKARADKLKQEQRKAMGLPEIEPEELTSAVGMRWAHEQERLRSIERREEYVRPARKVSPVKRTLGIDRALASGSLVTHDPYERRR